MSQYSRRQQDDEVHSYSPSEPEQESQEDVMPDPLMGTAENVTILEEALAPDEQPADTTGEAPEEEPESFDEMMRADAEGEEVTVRYSGWKDYLEPKGMGKFYPDRDYVMSQKCANHLLGLKNPDGTPAFEAV